MTQQEKEQLADRIVEILRADDMEARIGSLEKQLAAGDEGPDGMNSVVLAMAKAMVDHAKKGGIRRK